MACRMGADEWRVARLGSAAVSANEVGRGAEADRRRASARRRPGRGAALDRGRVFWGVLEQAAQFGFEPKRLGRICALEDAFAQFRDGETSPDAVRKEIERNRLDWVRVEGEALAFADHDVAREAALSVREGMAS